MKNTQLFLRKLVTLSFSFLFATSCVFATTSCNPSINDDNEFTVTFNGNGGTLVSGTEVQTVLNASEIVAPTYEKTGYDFDGWDKDISAILTDTTINAVWNTATYTVTWQNYDGSVLEVDENVPYGTTPSYNGSTPSKPSDGEYSYAFSGWSPAVTSVTSDQTYTAVFNFQFGNYPQSRVVNSALISTLNSARGTLPTSADSQAWTSYGYYIEGSVSSYMWYIDLANGSDEYRGVYFTSYRSYYTGSTSSTDNSYQDDNGYTTSNVYWFKYQPITWRILDVQAEKAFLMADLTLDSQDYHYSTSTRTIGGSTVYSNNYKESHIRSWLNDSFYNTAFSAEEKARIQTTNVDNSVASTGYSTNSYVCANTNDKAFLLSYAEAISATYGLSTTTSRQLAPSAYAKAQGVYTNTNGFNYWWLRSPDSYEDRLERIVYSDGSIYDYYVNYTNLGVVPALWISL